MFLHRLLHRLDNGVLKQCFVSYSQSVEFVSMCYDFDVMIDTVSYTHLTLPTILRV